MPEAETWRYRGQTIDREQIAFLRDFIREHPHSSRWKLSRQLCEVLGWKQANGALRDVVCRGLLLMLERAGEIELPPVRWRIVGQRRTARPRPAAVLIDTTPLTMPLGTLGAIEIQLVRRTADEPLFHSLVEQFHYLGYEQPVGEHLKYLVWAQGRPVACLAWSSAPRHLASRDRFIGWSGEERRRNIRFLALQHALSDSALGHCTAPGVAYPGPHGSPDLAGLGTRLRAPDLFSGNLHRSGTIPRDLLSGGELGGAGADHGARQRRSDASAEPVDQRGARAATPSPVSRVTSGGKVKPPGPEGTPRIDVSREELEALLEGVRPALGEVGYQKLQAAIRTLNYVTELLETREATLERLRRLLCHSSTEKTEKVLKQAGIETGEKKDKAPGAPRTPKSTAPGHGRNGADAYRGASKVEVPHGSLKAGDQCPDCQRGKVYSASEPGLLVRVKGQAPVAATVYELEKLRCTLCGDVFTAAAPEGVGEKKYDETAASMIALLRYGSGFPWNRLEGLQENLGIPLPAATQCEIVKETAVQIQPAMDELIRQAAQGDVVHNDDTSMRVLSLNRDAASDADIAAERTGVFTTGIVSTVDEGCRIGLYFTGRKHAGENLADVLKQRAAGLDAPIQMCDALSRNLSKLPEKLEIIVGHCLAHARRHFIEVTANFPHECRFVLESLGEVYGNDEMVRAQCMSSEQRLHVHQEHSGPVMEKLHTWLTAQFHERKVEPNSGLGTAISYLLKYWDRLTRFLRQVGAPLDNNICERALKKSILHRKNSLFYKNRNGAQMGDLFMSLIHTCELNGADPFDYLNQLQRHTEELKQTPSEWMPWNYRETLARTGALLEVA